MKDSAVKDSAVKENANTNTQLLQSEMGPSLQKSMMAAYQHRLRGFSMILDSLQETVAQDQALACMVGADLQQYRMDRVHELVQEVLNSEKEQIIIHLLSKCQ